MKKKNLIHPVMLFFSILPIALFSGCDKDTNCYLEVTVEEPGVLNPLSGEVVGGVPALGSVVEIYQERGNVHAGGGVDGSGVYKTYFKSPAIVKIKAKQPVGNAGERRGETSARLLEGETVNVRLVLGSQIF